MRVNDILELEIIDLDHFGLGVAKLNNMPIFINNALPGEIVKAKITRVTKNICEAMNLKIIKTSESRSKSICPYYYECGGCNIMHMDYLTQLSFKTKMVRNTIRKVTGLELLVNDCVPNPNQYHYRNKIIMPIGLANNEIVSGFYQEKTHDIIPIQSCMIEPLVTSEIINYFKSLLLKYKLTIYNEELHLGNIRNIMFRINYNLDIMAVIIGMQYQNEITSIANELKGKFNNIVSIYFNQNDKKTNVVLSDNYKLLYGDKYLVEDINELKFNVHPNSFLQINHLQCENMYNKAINYAQLSKTDNAIDAYCGIGSITLNLAKHVNHVYGIEIVPEAIINAKENMRINNIDNATFICGKCEEEIKKLVNKETIDVIFFDPPRKGCDIEFLKTVIDMKIKKIVYISCMPSTLARDLKILIDNGYIVSEITPFDLFSHQNHIENVAYLYLK